METEKIQIDVDVSEIISIVKKMLRREIKQGEKLLNLVNEVLNNSVYEIEPGDYCSLYNYAGHFDASTKDNNPKGIKPPKGKGTSRSRRLLNKRLTDSAEKREKKLSRDGAKRRRKQ